MRSSERSSDSASRGGVGPARFCKIVDVPAFYNAKYSRMVEAPHFQS